MAIQNRSLTIFEKDTKDFYRASFAFQSPQTFLVN